MKKTLIWMLLAMLGLGLLVGCGKKDKDEKVEDTPTEDTQAEKSVSVPEEQVAVDDGATEKTEPVPTFPEIQKDPAFAVYTTDVEITSTDPAGNIYGVKTQITKDNDRIAYNIKENVGQQIAPFETIKNVLLGEDFYMHVKIGEEEYWFKAPSVQDQAQQMFDLALIHGSFQEESLVKETIEEEINGQTMTCYYLQDPFAGKSCVLDGVFTYGETEDPTGMKTIINVSGYSEEIDESEFSVPASGDVQDMSALMEILFAEQAQDATGAVDIVVGTGA